jgi:hypothetical protein
VTAPPFAIQWVEDAADALKELKKRDPARYKKAVKAAKFLREIGPSYPGLHTHKYDDMVGPDGEDVWQSYMENKTPGAWRMWWIYGPPTDTITIVAIGPHPD